MSASFGGTARRGTPALWCQSALGPDGRWDEPGTWVPEDQAERITVIAREAGLRTVLDAYIGGVARDLDPGPVDGRA